MDGEKMIRRGSGVGLLKQSSDEDRSFHLDNRDGQLPMSGWPLQEIGGGEGISVNGLLRCKRLRQLEQAAHSQEPGMVNRVSS